ncbi:RAMP superfamily CRISPR-associated protein [Thermostichus sp. MS-CIW-34]
MRKLLPAERPRWYGLKEDPKHVDKECGYTPQTSDITDSRANRDITEAWNGKPCFALNKTKDPRTISIGDLKLISPLQIGGGSFPEGGILPAQAAGIPWIPGSSVRGSLLHYLREHWDRIPANEQAFWRTLLNENQTAWLPRKIRFENLFLEKSNLKPYPLNPQQPWQVFNQRDPKLGVQWQIPAGEGMNAPKYALNITLKEIPTEEQKSWVTQRMKEMLRHQGLGRGIHAGFGRIAERIPVGQWTIELQGMKPCVQQHKVESGQVTQQGQYRWSPQVLRANLRGWFTRLALPLLGIQNTERLTNKIFGGLGCPADLVLCSYKASDPLPALSIEDGLANGYANIPARDAHETWGIQVECNEPFQPLIGDLLNLAQQLGGLGPGWRRPPHQLTSFRGFRGSQFTLRNVKPLPLAPLIDSLKVQIRSLAGQYGIPVLSQPYLGTGCIFSIWESEDRKAWMEIVHGVCSTKTNPRPDWCGSSEHRPSGYSVRELKDRCRITVLDPDVVPTLKDIGFQQIWSA